jgi:hypothetical protein
MSGYSMKLVIVGAVICAFILLEWTAVFFLR